MEGMSLNGISILENELVENAARDHGKYFEHAQYALDFLHTFIKSTSYEGAFFLMFLSSVEKHITLGVLSGVRRHHVQANFNFRYATEAGSWAVYSLAHPDPSLFVEFESGGTLEPTKELKKKMYCWLDEKYPDGSASLKRFKDNTNRLSSHANIVDAQRNFGEFGREKITTFFFDQDQEHHIKTDLWAAANLSMGLLDLFYGVNKEYPQLVFGDDFLSRIRKLKADNDVLKAEMLNHLRLKPHVSKIRKS
ncbi:MAG: hypothetical protein A2408_00450 [Candidatus Yonathbacteria bacterium RIFOXYC1_FULL_52_10]|uniref:Uncharacterized protein n=1 Tax=Candidatus Yonathbacteria bacterium RIFOXYD1_FULL_52_36 TaxID=1802730 RepID=A0A1G2SMH2_9BACT|nr:MAG: hypothetical protein A2408_00450 [Candidatus Yonathbacteria bacterium RIFOXYC1_FULL_52_10]OHA86280.1 MAG: hypothetical protein A2591_01820 [Candidatus Yonathbacteria bacterium RIFOXYD1_FULL_52_36]